MMSRTIVQAGVIYRTGVMGPLNDMKQKKIPVLITTNTTRGVASLMSLKGCDISANSNSLQRTDPFNGGALNKIGFE